MGLLDETIGRIHPLDREAMYKAQKRWDDLYVGVGDLGKLEEMVIQYAGVTGEVLPEIPKCCMVVACADHGVYRQKVSAYPQSTTVGMVKSYVDVKGASANALALRHRAEQQQGELVAAQTESVVPAADASLQPLGNALQQLIAHIMTVGIVDRLRQGWQARCHDRFSRPDLRGCRSPGERQLVWRQQKGGVHPLWLGRLGEGLHR